MILLFWFWELYFEGCVDSVFYIFAQGFEEEAYHVELWEEFSGSYGVCVLHYTVSFRGYKNGEDPFDISCLADLESFEYESEAEGYYEGDDFLYSSEPREVAFYLAFIDAILLGYSCEKIYSHEGG